MERTAILDADAIVCGLEWNEGGYPAGASGCRARRKIHVIYNGIDLQQYQWTPYRDCAWREYGAKPPVCLTRSSSGRITRQKGKLHTL